MHFRKLYRKPPDVGANLTALWAAAPTPEAQANVEAFITRTGGMPGETVKDATRTRRNTGNEAAGRSAERLTRKWLERKGFSVTKSQDSQGAADLVAGKADGTWWVQCKSVSDYTPGCANIGVRELLGLSTFKRREIGPYQWLVCVVWMRGSDDRPLVVVKIDHEGNVTVSGQPAIEVAKEIERMLEAWGWEP
jgi:Holliday junction resolvase